MSTKFELFAREENPFIAMVALEKAIVKAEIANDLRFADVEKRINEYVEVTNTNIKTLTENQALNTGAKTGVKDFQSWVTWGITVLGFVLMYFVLRGV